MRDRVKRRFNGDLLPDQHPHFIHFQRRANGRAQADRIGALRNANAAICIAGLAPLFRILVLHLSRQSAIAPVEALA